MMEIVTQLIRNLGNYIFVPAVLMVFMLFLKRPLGEVIKSGIRIGIGFIGLTMVVNFMLEKMSPAIHGLAERTGSSLSAIDVGGAATAVMGFGSNLGAIVIPLCVSVNIIMLILRLTDCVNVDVFNLHQNASMGGNCSCIFRQLALWDFNCSFVPCLGFNWCRFRCKAK